MRAAAELEQERLEAAGEIDRVADAQSDRRDAPTLDSLVGVEIEVRWRYWVEDLTRKSKRRSVYIWCAGVVTEVADGRRSVSRRCRGVLCTSAFQQMRQELSLSTTCGLCLSQQTSPVRCTWGGD